jgi:hypothetical protein
MENITRFIKSLNGVFLPKKPIDDPLLLNMGYLLRNLDYIGIGQDRINMKNDIARFGYNFKNSTKKVKQ